MFSVRGIAFKPLASPKAAAAELAQKLRERAEELLDKENVVLKQMYTPNTQLLRKDFEAKYSKGAASNSEREVVDSLLKGIMPAQAASVLSSPKLLQRIVKDSMVPRRAATAEAEETVAAAVSQAAAALEPVQSADVDPQVDDSSDSEIDSAPAAPSDDGDEDEPEASLASLRSSGLEAALEALFEKHSARQVRVVCLSAVCGVCLSCEVRNKAQL